LHQIFKPSGYQKGKPSETNRLEAELPVTHSRYRLDLIARSRILDQEENNKVERVGKENAGQVLEDGAFANRQRV